MKSRVIGCLTVLAGLALSACGTGGTGSGSPSAGAPLKVAWIYVGSRSDAGWTKAHDDGRLMVEQHFGSRVQTTYKENVPEGPQVQQVIEQLVQDGNKLIFATSFGFQDAMDAEAKLHPDVFFEQATGFKTETNLAEYFGAAEDADYLTGMALGAATRNGKIGFVAPFPIPEVIREINAVTLGAQALHPGATVQVEWTNTWFDPAKEKQAAQSLNTLGGRLARLTATTAVDGAFALAGLPPGRSRADGGARSDPTGRSTAGRPRTPPPTRSTSRSRSHRRRRGPRRRSSAWSRGGPRRRWRWRGPRRRPS